MKSLLITLIALGSFLGVSAQSQNDFKVSAAVLSSFNTSFKQASGAQWQTADAYYKVSFELNGQYVNAFYDCSGALAAVTRNVSSLQLPITLQADLRSSYEPYWISELFELSNEGGTTYYVTLEDAETKITLQSVGNSWQVYQKHRKS